jgi:hypothetical protein
MRDDYDELDEIEFRRPPVPGTVRAAGVIWIVFGCLILLGAAANLVVSVGAAGAGAGPRAAAPGQPPAGVGICGALVNALFGAAFVFVGVQSFNGTARDTLGNGIGSIGIGLLNGGCGALFVAAGVAGGGAGAPLAVVVGAASILGGLGLLAAGVLALVGRAGYRAYKDSGRRRRRRPARED